mgnify:CR=1 FL=1
MFLFFLSFLSFKFLESLFFQDLRKLSKNSEMSLSNSIQFASLSLLICNESRVKYMQVKMSFCPESSTVASRGSKIRRGPKLEGCAFANFGNSSETEGELSHKIKDDF